MGEKTRLIDVPVQAIYADEIASAEIVGSIVRIMFCEKKTLDGERVRIPVVELLRPLESCLQLTLQDMLRVQLMQPPEAQLSLH